MRRHINVSRPLRPKDIRCGLVQIVLLLEEEVHREADVEGDGVVDLLHVLLRHLDAQGFDVGLEMFDLALADDGEDVGCFVENVCEGLDSQ